jgi:hypothetical protein
MDIDIKKIKDELEGYEIKVKMFKAPARYTQYFEHDQGFIKALKKRDIIKFGWTAVKSFDSEKIDELCVGEMMALIRNFPAYAAGAQEKEGDISFELRETVINKLVALLQKANQLNPNIYSVGTCTDAVTLKALDDVKHDQDKRAEERKELKEEMLSIIKEAYPNLENFDELSEKAMNCQLAIGMPFEMLNVAYPGEQGANKKENVKEGSVIIKTEWGSLGENQRGTIKYKTEVTSENGLITQWKDIN